MGKLLLHLTACSAIFAMSASSSFAAQPLKLRDYLQLVLENNQNIQAQLLAAEAARHKVLAERGSREPESSRSPSAATSPQAQAPKAQSSVHSAAFHASLSMAASQRPHPPRAKTPQASARAHLQMSSSKEASSAVTAMAAPTFQAATTSARSPSTAGLTAVMATPQEASSPRAR